MARKKLLNPGPKYGLRPLAPGDTLYRIEATRDIPRHGIKCGDRGGYVQGPHNLSQLGDCWISDNAKVFRSACVMDNAIVFGEARVNERAQVNDDARVGGSTAVSGAATIAGNAVVLGTTEVYGSACVLGAAVVTGKAKIFGNVVVKGAAIVSGTAVLSGNVIVKDRAKMESGEWTSGIYETGTFAGPVKVDPPSIPPMVEEKYERKSTRNWPAEFGKIVQSVTGSSSSTLRPKPVKLEPDDASRFDNLILPDEEDG